MEGAQLQVSGWPWYYVSVYFFLGGLAAGSYLLAAIADVFGDSEEDAPLIKTGHYLALALIIICPLLLIADLGQPLRFWRMLTQFKWYSPVSLGSWGLFLFGFFCALSAAIWMAKDGLFDKGPLSFISQELQGLPHRLIARIGAPFGIFGAGYTGVLLSATTNPFWNSNQFLGVTFLTSALSTAIAVVALLLIWRGHGDLIRVHNFRNLWLIVLGFEVFLVTWEFFHAAGDVLLTGQYLFTFVIGVVVIGVLIPLIILALRVGQPMSNGLLAIVAVLVLIGGFFFRYSVLEAGKEFIGTGEHAAMLLGWFG
jgi:formate-dependent nitrite reductase membrane component NrfD